MFKNRNPGIKQTSNPEEVIKNIMEQRHGDLKAFLNPTTNIHVENLDNAAEKIKEAIKNNEKITIVGDYDCDGVCATSIMKNTLDSLGADVDIRLPMRFSEGYGLSEKIIDEIDEGLILTVDNGIVAFDAIKKAKDKGLDIIVTDHHLPLKEEGETLFPEADIIVDAAAEKKSSFHDFCGASIAYLLSSKLTKDQTLNKDNLVLASIATIGDVMPLIGPNRVIVQSGLRLINQGYGGPVIQALKSKMYIDEHCNEEDYGFKLCPCINAAGRLYDNGAALVTSAIINADTASSWQIADKLISLNEKRKDLVKHIMETYVDTENIDRTKPVCIYVPAIETKLDNGKKGEIISSEGLIGIVAGKICEEYHTPCVCFTDGENGELKGSARSIEEIHLKNALDKLKDNDYLVRYGGHAGAAGLTIKKDKQEEFINDFTVACGPIPEKSTDMQYDAVIDSSQCKQAIDAAQKYGPFGEGNEKLVFLVNCKTKADQYAQIGDGSHFIIRADDLTLMGFGLTKKYEEADKPLDFMAIGALNYNWYKGKATPQMNVMDFEPAKVLEKTSAKEEEIEPIPKRQEILDEIVL